MYSQSLQPKYEQSHALVIGIDNYSSAPPLRYAVNDAVAIAKVLEENFAFPSANVHTLLDKDATGDSIHEHFMSLTMKGTGPNDRVLFFFAGHGCTVRSRRGDVGYLVPHDGTIDSLMTLIRWDDLTRNADFINAKHLFFIMDACYGGLAIMRHLSPGATRFLKDMLLRPARQVLTAGKANEQVSDLGGPLPDHSVFTGHFLEALNGKAANSDGLITANGTMAYVYQMVAHDKDSRQTPHFGYLEGDGDFIFVAPQLPNLQKDEKEDQDMLVSIPAVLTSNDVDKPMNIIEQTKEFLSDGRLRIKLSDLVTLKIKETLSQTAEDHFPISTNWSVENFLKRLEEYEMAISEVSNIESLIGYWGGDIHSEILSMPLRRICGRLGPASGTTGWIALRWYPALILLYKAGIASIAGGNYRNLKALFDARVHDPEHFRSEVTAILAVTSGLHDANDTFKTIPGRERNFTPRSEHLFKILQPDLDDLLFLGEDYERHFDRFEILYALEHANQYSRIWGPVGRFGWKYRSRGTQSPFYQLVSEGTTQGAEWPIIKAGLFGGSIDRFNEVTKQFVENILDRLNWY